MVATEAEFVTDNQALAVMEQPQSLAVSDPYVGMAMVRFTEAQAAILNRPVTTAEVQLRPDGIAYFPEIYYRRRLNEAFGPGAWALQIVRIAENGETIVAHCRLYAEGRFIAEALGEASYIPNNNSYTYATAAESAKSNGLMRCCKDLGIASELWDPAFLKEWLAVNAVQVWCTNIGSGQGAGKKKKMWRLKKDPPIDTFPWREGNADDKGKVQNNNRTESGQATTAQPPKVGSNTTRPVTPPPLKADSRPPAKISTEMAEKLRDTVTRRKMPPAEATKIFARFNFAKSTDVTENVYNEVLQALCDWKAPEAKPEPAPQPETKPAPQVGAKPAVLVRAEKEALSDRKKEIVTLGQKLLAAGIPLDKIESVIETKTGAREAKHIESSFDADHCIIALETLLEQAEAAKKATAKKKA